jgi:hypothetical protein
MSDILQKIRSVYTIAGIGGIVRKILHRMLSLFRPFFSVRFYAQLEMFIVLGYWPDFSQPRSFNEKVFCRKLFVPHPLSVILGDKWAAREYVRKQCGRDDILNEVLYVGSDLEQIPFETLPDRFVIKATHGSGWNIIVRDKRQIDRSEIIATCRTWLKSNYSSASRNFSETHYDKINPQVIVEKFIEDPCRDVPLDYKFFCFWGKVHCIQVDIERFRGHHRNMYSRDWSSANFVLEYPQGDPLSKPANLTEMIEVAEQAAADFDFCRVDLYSPDGNRIVFGELTLAPGSGLDRFYPREMDYRLGALWKMDVTDENSTSE